MSKALHIGCDIRQVNVSTLTRTMGMSRANWYKARRCRKRLEIDEELVLTLVREQRRLHPRMGCRKLHQELEPRLSDSGISIGRDRLFDLLGRHGLLVPNPPKSCRTTNSYHCLPVFSNLVRGFVPTGPNQVWVSDITYVRTDSGFVYLALIMDRYSRKIVGHHCGDSLEALGCIAALDRALADLPKANKPIHHSDRGCQYCCHQYVKRLTQQRLKISMTEIDHCAENAHAERINGTLKIEYGLGRTFRDAAQAKQAAEQAIWLYNNHRPHASIQMRYPADVHREAA